MIPLPLETVNVVKDELPIIPPFNKPEYKLPSIQRRRVTLLNPLLFCEKYRSLVDDDTNK